VGRRTKEGAVKIPKKKAVKKTKKADAESHEKHVAAHVSLVERMYNYREGFAEGEQFGEGNGYDSGLKAGKGAIIAWQMKIVCILAVTIGCWYLGLSTFRVYQNRRTTMHEQAIQHSKDTYEAWRELKLGHELDQGQFELLKEAKVLDTQVFYLK